MMSRQSFRLSGTRIGFVWVSALSLVSVPARGLRAQQTLTPRLLDIVRYNAPMIISEVNTGTPNCLPDCNYYRNRVTDHLIAVNFDGDDLGANNVYNMDHGGILESRPVVYFSIEETQTDAAGNGFFYIGYYFYHVRDGGAFVDGVTIEGGHDHDLEGIFLIVRKTPVDPYGIPIAALTEAHGALLPYGVPGQIDFNNALGEVFGIGGWAGQVEFWTDYATNRSRPVVAIRSSTHGTYMAQDANPSTTSYFYDGYGAVIPNNSAYSSAYTHSDASTWILYQPAPVDSYAAPMSNDLSTGPYSYRLAEVTPLLWEERGIYGRFFGGGPISIGFGENGMSDFYPDGANPMWQWQGGAGQRSGPPGHTGFWYSFAMDNTWNVHHDAGQWPTLSSAGRMLIAAYSTAYQYFPRYVGPPGPTAWDSFGGTTAYNAYYAAPPPTPPNALYASISGPTFIEDGTPTTYSASVTGGSGPYTYQWSGLATGSGATIDVTTSQQGTLYLDVYDASTGHAALSTYIRILCQFNNPC